MDVIVLEAGNLYRLKRQNYQGNTGNYGGLILKGDTVSVTILGSQTKPDFTEDMVDITEDGTIAAAGAYAFILFPEYITISGTVDSIELVNYVAEDLGEIASETP